MRWICVMLWDCTFYLYEIVDIGPETWSPDETKNALILRTMHFLHSCNGRIQVTLTIIPCCGKMPVLHICSSTVRKLIFLWNESLSGRILYQINHLDWPQQLLHWQNLFRKGHWTNSESLVQWLLTIEAISVVVNLLYAVTIFLRCVFTILTLSVSTSCLFYRKSCISVLTGTQMKWVSCCLLSWQNHLLGPHGLS